MSVNEAYLSIPGEKANQEALVAAVKGFSAVLSEFEELGANDSESRHYAGKLFLSAMCGMPEEPSSDAAEWELSRDEPGVDEPGVDEAAARLAESAKLVIDAIQKCVNKGFVIEALDIVYVYIDVNRLCAMLRGAWKQIAELEKHRRDVHAVA